MKQIIEMPYGDSSVLVAIDVPDVEEAEGVTIKKSNKDFSLISKAIVTTAKPILKSFEELGKESIPPTKASASFSVSLQGGGSFIIGGEGTISVEIEWDLKRT